MKKQSRHNDFYVERLAKFVGYTVTGTISDEHGEFFGLALDSPKGKQVLLWFQSDDEGNGPGSFSVDSI